MSYKITEDFFNDSRILILSRDEKLKESLLFYIMMLAKSDPFKEKSRMIKSKYSYPIESYLSAIYGIDNEKLRNMLSYLSEFGLVVWKKDEIMLLDLIPDDNKERVSKKCKIWRQKVLEKSNGICQACGMRAANLEAHHLKSWKTHRHLRFEVSNGIALCKRCHKKAHGGRNG